MLLTEVGDLARRLADKAVVVAAGGFRLVLALLPEDETAGKEEDDDRVGEVEGVAGYVAGSVFGCGGEASVHGLIYIFEQTLARHIAR